MIKRKDLNDLLAESLQELAAKKSVDKITIADIANNCGVRRETFYHHFCDKYDLIEYIYVHNAHDALFRYNGCSSWVDAITESLAFIQGQHKLFHSALKDQSLSGFKTRLLGASTTLITKTVTAYYQTDEAHLSPALSSMIDFYAHGCVGLIADWLNSGAKESPAFIGNVIAASTPPILWNVFRLDIFPPAGIELPPLKPNQ